MQKHIGTRLRKIKRILMDFPLSGKRKLTDNFIKKELSVFDRFAIHRNCDSVQNMKRAIWNTFFHMSFTDPQNKYILSHVVYKSAK